MYTLITIHSLFDSISTIEECPLVILEGLLFQIVLGITEKLSRAFIKNTNPVKSSESLLGGGETQQRKEESSSTWSVDLNDGQDDDNNVNILNFYNADFGKSKIPDAASFDQYGNPKGTNYDLGKDGAFNNYSILIAQFYQDSQFDDKAMQVPIDTLKAKGFQVSHVKNEQECIRELKTNRYAVAWIISTASITQHDFISALTTFHHEGGALFLFADNVPYICHASEFLKLKFGITLDGSYMGYKTLTFIENGHQQLGHFGQHDIFTGIENLFEGVTICHPIYPSETIKRQFLNLATATDGNPTIGVYDPISGSNEGRLALDCGFTKLYINWDSAGTARYIVNVSCWLLGIDKRLNQTKTRR